MTKEVANSVDIDRVYALNSVIQDIDELLDAPQFKENTVVRNTVDLLHGEGPMVPFKKEKIAVDFSSPNVAKPFHIGHLRSTFIGRAFSNLFGSNGSDIVRINYLGDWGTQFGLLAAGFNSISDETDKIQLFAGDFSTSVKGTRRILPDGKVSLRQYYELYVKANALAETDPRFRQKALDYFAALEEGKDDDALQFWLRVVGDSVEELKELYERLHIQFDVWESENEASFPARQLVKELEKRKVLERGDGNVVGIRLDVGTKVQFVPLVKSDGTTLYLTRDVYTALRRFDDYGCTKIYYVTDDRQRNHFLLLKKILAKIGREDVANSITHVSFGRVRNMSTRKGTAIFVDDILNEGAEKAEEVLRKDAHTKAVPGTIERRQLCEQMSLTGLVVNDLRKRLCLEYDFDWSSVFDTKKDGGVNLQKTFCRLSSICQRSDHSSVDLDTFRQSMNERESLQLIAHLSRQLAPALMESQTKLELYPLTHFLFRLRKLSGAAVKGLRVADAPTPALRSSRFMLFDVSRKVLGLGLRLLGAKPLARI